MNDWVDWVRLVLVGVIVVLFVVIFWIEAQALMAAPA